MSFTKNFTEVTANLYRSFITPVAEFVIEKYKIDVSVSSLVDDIKENLNLPEAAPAQITKVASISAGINSFAPSLNMSAPLPVMKNAVSTTASTPTKKTRGTATNKPVQVWLPLEEFKEERAKDAKICAYMSNRIKDEEKRGKVCSAVADDCSDPNPLKWRCVSCKGKASDIEKEFEKENKASKKSASITGVVPPIPSIDAKTISLPSGTIIPPGMNFSNLNVPPIPSIDVKPSTPKSLVPPPKIPSPKKEVPSVPELPSIPVLPSIPSLPSPKKVEPVVEPEAPKIPTLPSPKKELVVEPEAPKIPSLPSPKKEPEPVVEPEPVKEPEAPVLPPAPKPATPKPASPVAINPQPYAGFNAGHYMLEFKNKQYLFGMNNGKYYIHGKFVNLSNPAPATYTQNLVAMDDSEIAQFAGVLAYEFLGPVTPSVPVLPVINLPGIPSIPGL